MENRIAIISTNSHTNAELAVMPNCSGVNLKKKEERFSTFTECQFGLY